VPREEHRLRVLVSRVLRRIFGTKREEMASDRKFIAYCSMKAHGGRAYKDPYIPNLISRYT
jgi:hypothetical protein